MAAVAPCCLAASDGIDGLGLNVLLSGIGNLFQKGKGDVLESTNHVAAEPVVSAETPETSNTEELQRETGNKDGRITPSSASASASAATANFDILGGLGPLANDATPSSAAVAESFDLPGSVETVVHTQILVVAPDRIKEVVVSEPQLLSELESESAAPYHLLTWQFLLLSLLPMALAVYNTIRV
ncbi:hypothetical protein IW140_006347 [Coemansia sp. RSA 1813]|nr:hypothetical protein EV178_006326 [Coemansia sp. RSA 1646]KAJ1765827.1 hypothetical protein LPJ74_006184 [Coemansia sp. RSA 1843]KAJ2085495.1 hypothetical protein IW138_006297 [Coemansia sp. RSA 986]KAJ2217824.1 hypothetical protein EV179_000310 [Coemansia sp. RSA 487]KAJ2562733.1 hypothetical protein IW140_006347 [Coemansia sp. RSA 1813]